MLGKTWPVFPPAPTTATLPLAMLEMVEASALVAKVATRSAVETTELMFKVNVRIEIFDTVT